MKKKIISSLLVMAMVATALVGCGAPAEKATEETTTDEGTTEEVTEEVTEEATEEVEVTDVTLKVWTPQNQHDNNTIQSMSEAFQAAHPEYNITWVQEVVGEDKAKEQVLLDVENAADVFFYANDQMVELANAGALAKLGGETLDMINSTMSPAVVGTVTNPMDGGVYGIPFTHNTFFMFYDKTLLTEDDIKSLDTIVAKETADGVTNFFFDAAGGWKSGAFHYGAGNKIYGDSQFDFAAGCDWNNETGVAVTNYLIDLKNNSKVAFNNGFTVAEAAAEHKIAAWWDGAWNYQTYKDALGDDLGLAILPTFNINGEDKQLLGFYGSKAIGVNAQSKNLPVAIQFAAFLGNEENQIKRFEESAQIPTNINAGNSEIVTSDEVASVIVKEAQVASVTQPLAAEFGSKYWGVAGPLIDEIANGGITKDNVQEKMDTFAGSFVIE